MIINLLYVVLFAATCLSTAKGREFDVVVYGATPGGIAAAVTAARLGRNVTIVERQMHVGGMTSSGLSISDVVTLSAYGGFFKEFYTRVFTYYASTYGNNSVNAELSRNGIVYEPSVAESIFLYLLKQAGVSVQLGWELTEVARDLKRINRIHTKNSQEETMTFKGEIFIDATYEGDMMAYAGAKYEIGREGRAKYGELNAGRVFQEWKSNEFLLGSTGESDDLLPAYTYRMSLTNDAAHRVSIALPDNYNRSIYLGYLVDVSAGRIPSVLDAVSALVVTVPNNKTDLNINPHPLGFVFTGLNAEYPDSNWTIRTNIALQIKDITLGLLYFLQNDASVNATNREAALQWGMDDREFNDTDYFPRQLYVREARRLVGEYVFTEHDLSPIYPASRTPVHRDTICVGEYPTDIFPVSGVPPNPAQSAQIPSATPEGYVGMYQNYMRPFQIPLRALISPNLENLLVPVALSSSHVGFSSLRLEPTWMNIGSAAGAAAHVALLGNRKVKDVQPEKLQRILLGSSVNQLLTWFEDMSNPYAFESMQFFGTKSFFTSYSVLPSDPVSRVECAHWFRLILALANLQLPHGSYPLSWSDFGPNDDYFDDVLGLALLGVIPLPSQNKYFYPNEQMEASDFNSWLIQMGELLNISPTEFNKAVPQYMQETVNIQGKNRRDVQDGLVVGDVCNSLYTFLQAAGY